jgi:hypothetical protein
MVAFLFRDSADSVDEIESAFEIGKDVIPFYVMLLDDAPIRELGCEFLQVRAF